MGMELGYGLLWWGESKGMDLEEIVEVLMMGQEEYVMRRKKG